MHYETRVTRQQFLCNCLLCYCLSLPSHTHTHIHTQVLLHHNIFLLLVIVGTPSPSQNQTFKGLAQWLLTLFVVKFIGIRQANSSLGVISTLMICRYACLYNPLVHHHHMCSWQDLVSPSLMANLTVLALAYDWVGERVYFAARAGGLFSLWRVPLINPKGLEIVFTGPPINGSSGVQLVMDPFVG